MLGRGPAPPVAPGECQDPGAFHRCCRSLRLRFFDPGNDAGNYCWCPVALNFGHCEGMYLSASHPMASFFFPSAYANVVLELLSCSFIPQKSADNLSDLRRHRYCGYKSALQHGSEGIVSGTDIYFGQWTDNSSDVRWVRYCGSIALAKPPLQ